MILYFQRVADGAIITRELGEAAGVTARLSPPAGTVPLEPGDALAELGRLAAERDRRRTAEAAGYAQTRADAFAELVALGLSPAAAGALSGHRPVEGGT